MNTIRCELERYHRLNCAAQSGCAVLFGSGLLARIPAGELARDLGADTPVYNRSIDALTLADAEDALSECVYPLSPSMLFINLGEEDLRNPCFSLNDFLSSYEWLLYTINSRIMGKTKLYIISVLSPHPLAAAVNEGLARLADETGCTYIDVTRAACCDNPEVRIFEILRRFLRGHAIHFSEAFQVGSHAAI